MFLLLGEISQQQTHDQQVHRKHKKTFGFEIDGVYAQPIQKGPGKISVCAQTQVKNDEAFRPQQRNLCGRSG
jgi:hypothetical protein